MGRIALIGALVVLTIIQIAATSSSDYKIPKGENLYDLHLEGDSIVKKDSVKINSRDYQRIAIDSIQTIKPMELPTNFRIFSRAMPRDYLIVADSNKTKKNKKKK
jgi:hypothetical protein